MVLMKTNCRKQTKQKSKKKFDKLYVKWKDYDNSLNCWINKEGVII